MAQKKFKKANSAKLFNYNVFFGDYLQYISWSVKNSKTVDMLTLEYTLKYILGISICSDHDVVKARKYNSLSDHKKFFYKMTHELNKKISNTVS